MLPLFKKLCVLTLALFALPSYALNVVTSIKPIGMITEELMIGVAQPTVLLGSNTSPHDYALRPSDVKTLKDADLVIWFGEGLEAFLEPVLENNPNALELASLPSKPFFEFSEHHHDDGHNHGNLDPHFWLGVDVVKAAASGIVDRLIVLDAKNKQQYQHNLATFIEKLEQSKSEIEQQLSPVIDEPYYVFHDAYGYFERQFGLSHEGYFTVSPERKPGAKTLVAIKRALSQFDHVCVFKEPQFEPAIIRSITRGTNAEIGTLDPVAGDLSVEPGSYFKFIHSIADSFYNCLTVKK